MPDKKEGLKSKSLKITIICLVLIATILSIYFAYKYYAQKQHLKHSHNGHSVEHDVDEIYYTCPMHPTIKNEKPGSCPICGMNLVKKKIKKKDKKEVKSTDHSKHKDHKKEDQVNGIVSLSPQELMLANVRTSIVRLKSVDKEIEAFGVIKYDTNNLSSVPTWVEGRIDKLYYKAVGDKISKGKVISDIFSPDLISAQKEYIVALNNYQSIKKNTDQKLVNSYIKTIEAAKTRLKYWGLNDIQIESLNSFEEVKSTVPIYSDYSGEIITINVLEGNYVKEGDILYKVADFSTLWLEAEVNESDISFIKKGDSAVIKLDSYPEKNFYGVVNYIYPYIDKKTRTAIVRINMNNRNNLLKPDMYAKVFFKLKPYKILAIPRKSVLYTGTKNFVWIEKADGEFEIRKIKVGKTFGDYIEVLGGLKEGDKVVSSGGFLIDSEAQLSSPAHSGGHQH